MITKTEKISNTLSKFVMEEKKETLSDFLKTYTYEGEEEIKKINIFG